MILQHLFLGINAHINYDLVFTLVLWLDVVDKAMGEQTALHRGGEILDGLR